MTAGDTELTLEDPFGHPGVRLPGEPRRPRAPRPWYKRTGLLVTAAVVAIVAATVISDLPTRATHANQAANARTIVRSINSDLQPCAFAATQTFAIYHGILTNTLTAADKAHVAKYLRDDQQACSYANQAIFSLSTITVPTSPMGRDLGSAITDVLQWCTSDALAAIVDIETLRTSPKSASAKANLHQAQRRLAADRALAFAAVHRASAALGGTPIGQLAIPRLPPASTPTP